jgi:hypothetical protein
LEHVRVMSALLPKADMVQHDRDALFCTNTGYRRE